MDNKGLRYINKYIPTSVFKGSIDVTEQENFKKFYLDKKKATQKKKLEQYLETNIKPDLLGKVPQHILSNQDYQFKKFLNNDLMSTNSIDFQTTTDIDFSDQNAKNTDEFRYIQPIRTLINIDSRDRDFTLYPKPNNYKISLNHTFTNVKRISLRSTEFPNSIQLIRNTPLRQANNSIFWQDQGDSTIYSASLDSGNYQPTSLANQIQNQMNLIPKLNGESHNFTVTIDQVTDTVTFSSFDIFGANNVLSSNPSTQGIITVTLPTPHGYETGDNIIVRNATSFSNIPGTEINGEKTITIIGLVNSTVFTYPISDTIIIQDIEVNQGGNIEFAKGSNFKLLFDKDNTPVDILGFKAEETIFSSEHKNTTVAESFAISDIYSLDSTFTAIILNKVHNIPQGNEIRFNNITEFSDDVNQLFTEGIGYRILPLSPEDLIILRSFNFDPVNQTKGFKISLDTSGEFNQSFSSSVTITNSINLENGFVGIKMSRLFPIITGLYPYVIGFSNLVAVEMDNTHGLENGQIITISDIPELGSKTFTISDLSSGDITELQNISLNDSNYDIFNTETNFDRFFKITVTTGVSYRKYYRNMGIELFGFKEFPDDFTGKIEIGSRSTHDNVFLMLEEFIHTDEGFPVVALTEDDLLFLDGLIAENSTLDIRLDCKIKTSEPIEKNVNAVIYNGQYSFIRTINKPIVLSGENFIFMTSPNIDDLVNSGSMKNTGLVSNIFAKITLSAPPGSIIFNSFISNPIIYEDSPLTQLSELEYSFRDRNNELFEFNDTDHSFTIEIVEYRDKLMYNDFDSRRGRYDNIGMRQNFYS